MRGGALSRFAFSVSSQAGRGGTARDSSGRIVGVYVTTNAVTPLWLATGMLRDELKRAFPGTRTPEFDDWKAE